MRVLTLILFVLFMLALASCGPVNEGPRAIKDLETGVVSSTWLNKLQQKGDTIMLDAPEDNRPGRRFVVVD